MFRGNTGKSAGSARQPLCVPNRRHRSERRDQYALGLRWLATGCSLAPFGMPSRPRPSAGFREREELAASPPPLPGICRCFRSAVRCPRCAVRCPAARRPLPHRVLSPARRRPPLCSVRCPLSAVRRVPYPARRCSPLFSVRCPPSAVRGPRCAASPFSVPRPPAPPAVFCPRFAVRCLAVFCTPPAVVPRCFRSAVRCSLPRRFCAPLAGFCRCVLSAVRGSLSAVRRSPSAVRRPLFAVRCPAVPLPAVRCLTVFCPPPAVAPRCVLSAVRGPRFAVFRTPPAVAPRCVLSAVPLSAFLPLTAAPPGRHAREDAPPRPCFAPHDAPAPAQPTHDRPPDG